MTTEDDIEKLLASVPEIPGQVSAAARDTWLNATTDTARCDALRSIVFEVEHGNRELGIEFAARSLDFAHRTGDHALIVKGMLLHAFQNMEALRTDQAMAETNEAIRFAREVRDTNPLPFLQSISTRALINLYLGDEHAARADFETVLMATADPVTVTVARINIAALEDDAGHPARALHHLECAGEVLSGDGTAGMVPGASDYFQQARDLGLLTALVNAAEEDVANGIDNEPRLVEVERICARRRAVDRPEDRKSHMFMAAAEVDVLRLRGDLAGASRQAAIAVELAEQNRPQPEHQAYASRAKLFEALGDDAAAIEDWKRALELCRPGGRRLLVQPLLARIAAAYERIGDLGLALETTREAFREQQQVVEAIRRQASPPNSADEPLIGV